MTEEGHFAMIDTGYETKGDKGGHERCGLQSLMAKVAGSAG